MTIAGRRKPKAYAAQTVGTLQRIEVMTRDDWRCRFEIRVDVIPGETHHNGERVEREDGAAWARCGNEFGLQTAHVFRRWKCGDHMTDDGIALKDHPLVAIAGCRDCHARFDKRGDPSVRAPADAVRMASTLIEHTLEAAKASLKGVARVDLTEFDRSDAAEEVIPL